MWPGRQWNCGDSVSSGYGSCEGYGGALPVTGASCLSSPEYAATQNSSSEPRCQDSRSSDHISLQFSLLPDNVSLSLQNVSGGVDDCVVNPPASCCEVTVQHDSADSLSYKPETHKTMVSDLSCDMYQQVPPTPGGPNCHGQDELAYELPVGICGQSPYPSNNYQFNRLPASFTPSSRHDDSLFPCTCADTYPSHSCGSFIGISNNETTDRDSGQMIYSYPSRSVVYVGPQHQVNDTVCNTPRCVGDYQINEFEVHSEGVFSARSPNSTMYSERNTDMFIPNSNWNVPRTPGSSVHIADCVTPEIVCLVSPDRSDDNQGFTVSSQLPNISYSEQLQNLSPQVPMTPRMFSKPYQRCKTALDFNPQTPRLDIPPPTPGGFEESCSGVFDLTPVPSPEMIDLCRSSPTLHTDPTSSGTTEINQSPEVVEISSTPNIGSTNSSSEQDIHPSDPAYPSFQSQATVIFPPAFSAAGDSHFVPSPSSTSTPICGASKRNPLRRRSQQSLQCMSETSSSPLLLKEDDIQEKNIFIKDEFQEADTKVVMKSSEDVPSYSSRDMVDSCTELEISTSLEGSEDLGPTEKKRQCRYEPCRDEEDEYVQEVEEVNHKSCDDDTEGSENFKEENEEDICEIKKSDEEDIFEIKKSDEYSCEIKKSDEEDSCEIKKSDEIHRSILEINPCAVDDYTLDVSNLSENNKLTSTIELSSSVDVREDRSEVGEEGQENKKENVQNESTPSEQSNESDDSTAESSSEEQLSEKESPFFTHSKKGGKSKEEGQLLYDEESEKKRGAKEKDQPDGGQQKQAGRWEKRMRGLGASFIIQEAEEGDAADEEEEEDGEWIDDEASEASEAAAAAAAAEALRRRESDDVGWRSIRPHSPTVSDIMNRLRLDHMEAERAEIEVCRFKKPNVPKQQVDQQALLPGISDPSLWMIPCRPGHERIVVFTLMRKYLRRSKMGSADEIRIHSAVFSGSAPRFVYVEALRKQHVIAAVCGIDALPRGFDRMKQVPIDEMSYVLKTGKGVHQIKQNEWVRPHRGLYRDDAAVVEEVDPTEEFAVVRLLPRVDYGQLAGTYAHRGGAVGRGRSRGRGGKRPSARRLDVEALRGAGVDVSAAPSGMLIFKRETYKDGYLLKRYPLKSLRPTQPTLSEVQIFNAEDGQGLLLAEEPKKWLGLDDRVEVFEGGLAGMRGTVVEIKGETVALDVDELNLGTPVKCAIHEVRKIFNEGQHVRVMEGTYRDATGMVVKTNAERLVFTEDDTNREIEVLVRQVRLAQNSSPAPTAGLRRGSIVKLRDDSVAVVMRVTGATVRVLDAFDRERDLPLRAARPYSLPPRVRAFPALDCEQNELRIRDKVLAVEGSYKGKSGTVLAVLHSKVFIETHDGNDRCLFAAPATHLRLQGGASDRQSMFLRQLDPGSSLGVLCATPHPASPGVMPPPTVPGPDRVRRSRSSYGHPTPSHVDGEMPQGDFGAFDRGLQRDPHLMGCVVSVTAGAYKSRIGTVRRASRASALVELHSPRTIVSIKRSHLRVVEGSSGSGAPPRARYSGSNRPSPYPVSSGVGFYGSQVPLKPPRAPASPQPLPSPAFQGLRESPIIPAGFRTPASAITATPMYDAGNRTPLPTPQSPAPLAAVWEARATPGNDSVGSSPLGYLSVPLEYLPPAPPDVLTPTPCLPGTPAPQLPAGWPRPGMEVTVPTAPGHREVATVRAVTGDGGVTMVLRSGVLLTLGSSDQLLPVKPLSGDNCCVVVEDDDDDGLGGVGKPWGRRAFVIEVVDENGVLRPERDNADFEVLPLAHLCKVTCEYVPSV